MKLIATIGALVTALVLVSPAHADHRFGPVFTIDPEHAAALIARGGVAPIDLRPESEFQTGRLPGARSLPLATLASRTEELPPDGVILLYGDGPNERLFRAYHFVRARRAGAVYLLDGGIDGWRRVGYPLEH
ncbi:MAG TPA: rhodanese-like domain-containing protein [Methylomirabilota bacterium]|jgi:ArsR family transcriptional regulator